VREIGSITLILVVIITILAMIAEHPTPNPARISQRTTCKKRKKRQAPHIAPLQPLILAAFRPWGGSAGAGRVRPAGRKDRMKRGIRN
jgi:hypothetical protein